MKTCVFVLGMHRSGTSAITGALEKIGVMLPQDLMPPNSDNPKGYFEGIRVMQINDAFLTDVSSNWDDTRFSVPIDEEVIKKHLPEVIKFIEEEFSYSKIFALKDPRICITFPLWERALKEIEIDIKIIFPYRNPLEIARSLKLRNGFSVEKSLLLWAKYILHAENLSRSYSRHFVGFSDFLNNTPNELAEIANFVGLKPDSTAVKEVQESFLEKKLKHHNLDATNIADNLPNFMQALISFVQKNSFSTVAAQEFDRIRNDFAAIDQFMHTRDVQLESQLARDLDARWGEERARVVALEAIKDPLFVEEAYYLDRNPDVSQSKTNPTYHYMEFGKQEGRYPNRYCEQYHLNVKEISSPSEGLYWARKALSEKESELADQQQQFKELEAEKNALSERQDTLNQNLENQLNELQASSQTRIAELEAEKNALSESQEMLNQELESLLADLQSVKDAKQSQKVELESELNELQASGQTRIAELDAEKNALSESQETLNQELESLLADLQNVKDAKQSQKVELESQFNDLQASSQTRIAELEQEIQLLTQSIDQIVSDLASIKESKCWVYTKPIRHLSKLFKHENREVK